MAASNPFDSLVNKDDESERKELLFSGYLRETEKDLNYVIPDLINYTIKLFYPFFSVYGVGNYTDGHFGCNKVGKFKQFTKLNTFSEYIVSPHKIYSNYHTIVVQSMENKLYAAGGIGLNPCSYPIGDQLTQNKSSFSQINSPSNNTHDYLISKSLASSYSFIANTNSSTQKLFCCGDNNQYQLGLGADCHNDMSKWTQMKPFWIDTDHIIVRFCQGLKILCVSWY